MILPLASDQRSPSSTTRGPNPETHSSSLSPALNQYQFAASSSQIGKGEKINQFLWQLDGLWNVCFVFTYFDFSFYYKPNLQTQHCDCLYISPKVAKVQEIRKDGGLLCPISVNLCQWKRPWGEKRFLNFYWKIPISSHWRVKQEMIAVEAVGLPLPLAILVRRYLRHAGELAMVVALVLLQVLRELLEVAGAFADHE